MTIGMTARKIAVSIPQRTLARAQRAVRRGRAPSMSAYVTAAVEERVKLDELAQMLDEMLAETGGPLTAAERRAADEALFGPGHRKKKSA